MFSIDTFVHRCSVLNLSSKQMHVPNTDGTYSINTNISKITMQYTTRLTYHLVYTILFEYFNISVFVLTYALFTLTIYQKQLGSSLV